MDDLLSDPSEDNVSDVDPEELQKMLEGLDFSDEESNVRPNAKKTTTTSSYSKVPKSSNLKSSIKTTSTTASANGSGGIALGTTTGGGDNPRKVQFSKDTKPAASHFDTLDASNESSTFTGLESPGKKQQLLSTSSSDTTAVSSTTSAAVPTSSSKAGNSSNVGHPNKSKVMHELFGIEKSAAAAGTANNGNNASDLRDAKMTTATRARNTPVKMDEDDDLFAGLGEPKIKAKQVATSNNDFMSSLFGSDGSSSKSSNRRGSTTKEFVLEDKYTKKSQPEINNTAPARGPGRRGSGTPFLNTEQPKNHITMPEPVIPQQPSQPPSHTQLEFTEAPTVTIRTPTSSSSTVVNDNLQKQMNQMEDFEREQNTKFLREIEDHKRQLEMQQMEHRTILDQQRNMAKEQLKVLQDRQSSALLQQQNQSEMLMKQLQSQMEAEMRMKTELVRHQMQILSEVQSDSDFNEVISRFAAPTSIKAKASGSSGEEMYKKREDRLKAAHAEEIEEMQKRLAHWSRRVQQMSEEHQKELESEREKRKRDLKEQSEDHKATVDTIRADYAVLVDKIKELKTLELEASYETRDSSKAIDTLLNQMSLNMDEVQGLRHGLEDRISKHVDVREALLKKKDEQLQALQKELVQKSQENQLEQKELKEMIEKLQNQLSSRDVELRSKEFELHRRQNHLDEERRKFETEQEITFAKLKEDQVRLQEQKVNLSEERRQLHRAVEKEHRLIVAERAKAAIGKRLQGQSQDNHITTKTDKTFEIEAMIKAVESEKSKMKDEWKLIKETKEKLKEKRGLLREDKKLLDVAMKKFATIDHHLESRLDKVSNLAEDSSRVKKECQQMMNEVKAIEASRAKAISEAKSEAVQRLEAVEREAQRLEALREAVNKERRKLLHTQSAILCSRCTKPIIIEDHSKELSNLGLRTAGDGETISSSIHQFASLRKDALRDQEYLARESRYLQSIAVADL